MSVVDCVAVGVGESGGASLVCGLLGIVVPSWVSWLGGFVAVCLVVELWLAEVVTVVVVVCFSCGVVKVLVLAVTAVCVGVPLHTQHVSNVRAQLVIDCHWW